MPIPTKAQLEAEWVQLRAMTEAAKTAIAQRAVLLDLCERCLRALDEDDFPGLREELRQAITTAQE